jgi:hypothetical protein
MITMIALKRNDKIIIIAAIAVIVIAGVGIAAYTPEDIDDIELPMNGNQYTITWKTTSGTTETISGFASKDAAKNEQFTIDEKNIKSIMVNMSWVDDKTTLLGRFGLDTMQLKITDPDGGDHSKQVQSTRKTGRGDISITIPVNDRYPTIDVIEANSSIEAEEMVKSEHSSDMFTNEEFQIKVSCSIGERRILKRIFERGNSYSIEISYEYYYPSATEETASNNNMEMFNDLTGNNYKPPFLSMIIGTGCGRYI